MSDLHNNVVWVVGTLLMAVVDLQKADHVGIGPHCGSGYYACSNGKCITWERHCDGIDHCGNYDDEDDCGEGQNSIWVPFAVIPPIVFLGIWIWFCLRRRNQWRTERYPRVNLAMTTTDETRYTPWSTQSTNTNQPYVQGYPWVTSPLPPKYTPSEPPPAYSTVVSESGRQQQTSEADNENKLT